MFATISEQKAIPNIPCHAFLIQFPIEESSRFIFNIKTKVGMEKLWALNKLIPISELTSRVKARWSGESGATRRSRKQKLKHANSWGKDNDHDFFFAFHHLLCGLLLFSRISTVLPICETWYEISKAISTQLYLTKLRPTPIRSVVPFTNSLHLFPA